MGLSEIPINFGFIADSIEKYNLRFSMRCIGILIFRLKLAEK